jgi:hypothetical protein
MGNDEWTVVGGKGSKQGGKSKVLSLKAAEQLNEVQQENWRLQVGESPEESMDGWGTQQQGRKRGKKARGDISTIDRHVVNQPRGNPISSFYFSTQSVHSCIRLSPSGFEYLARAHTILGTCTYYRVHRKGDRTYSGVSEG